MGSGGFARGRAALHDALLLSECSLKLETCSPMCPACSPMHPRCNRMRHTRCDFLLKSASAIPEFALWVRPALHESHVDLQLEERGAR